VKHASSRRRLRYGNAVLFLCYDSTGATSAIEADAHGQALGAR